MNFLGTTNEGYADYFDRLLEAMKKRYPQKKLMFLKDNLWAHKCVLICRMMQDEQVKMLLTPSNTPEFSPIENMFSYVKRKMTNYNYGTREEVSMRVCQEMFKIE